MRTIYFFILKRDAIQQKRFQRRVSLGSSGDYFLSYCNCLCLDFYIFYGKLESEKDRDHLCLSWICTPGGVSLGLGSHLELYERVAESGVSQKLDPLSCTPGYQRIPRGPVPRSPPQQRWDKSCPTR